MNLLRAWIADSLIQLGWAIAPDHYLEQLMGEADGHD